MKEYFKRMRDVLTFFAIWFGLPHIMVIYTQDPAMYAWIVIMWLPAILLACYLRGEPKNN